MSEEWHPSGMTLYSPDAFWKNQSGIYVPRYPSDEDVSTYSAGSTPPVERSTYQTQPYLLPAAPDMYAPRKPVVMPPRELEPRYDVFFEHQPIIACPQRRLRPALLTISSDDVLATLARAHATESVGLERLERLVKRYVKSRLSDVEVSVKAVDRETYSVLLTAGPGGVAAEVLILKLARTEKGDFLVTVGATDGEDGDE